jgi:serine/threonine protein kinase
MGCMGDKGGAPVCPLCGWREGRPPDNPQQLPPRTLLKNRYLLGRVLGQGGFGITYLAWDTVLDRKLAIKEHFPREFCTRSGDGNTVQPNPPSRSSFEYGLQKFAEEGQALAHFQDNPGIVTMLDFVRANGTAYIVMAYAEGCTLEEYLEQNGGRISYDLAIRIILPVMDALRAVHAARLLHRDVTPGNIYVNSRKQVRLLDFGSARDDLRQHAPRMTVLFKPGYAPIEQYSSRGGDCGTWTDVYGVAATLYRTICGAPPLDAPARLGRDGLSRPSKLGIAIPELAEAALLKALAVQPQHRFQTVAEFQAAILASSRVAVAHGTGASTGNHAPSRNRPALFAAAILLALVVLGIAVAAVYSLNSEDSSLVGALRGLFGKKVTVQSARAEIAGRHPSADGSSFPGKNASASVSGSGVRPGPPREAALAGQPLSSREAIFSKTPPAGSPAGRAVMPVPDDGARSTPKPAEPSAMTSVPAPNAVAAEVQPEAPPIVHGVPAASSQPSSPAAVAAAAPSGVPGGLSSGARVPDHVAEARHVFDDAREKLAAKSFSDASVLFGRAARLKPDWEEPWVEKAKIEVKLGEYPQAIEDLTEALQLKPDDAVALNLRGYARYNRNQLTEAISDFDQAIALRPDDPEPYLNRGNAKWACKDEQGAKADFDKAHLLRKGSRR